MGFTQEIRDDRTKASELLGSMAYPSRRYGETKGTVLEEGLELVSVHMGDKIIIAAEAKITGVPRHFVLNFPIITVRRAHLDL